MLFAVPNTAFVCSKMTFLHIFSFSSCSVNPMISLAKNAETFMTVNNRKFEVAFI